MDYGDANREGWVCVVYGSAVKKSYIPDFFCVRLNPETATKDALKSLMKLVNKANNQEFVFEDIWTDYFKDFTSANSIVDKIGARQLIREIIAGKVRSRH